MRIRPRVPIHSHHKRMHKTDPLGKDRAGVWSEKVVPYSLCLLAAVEFVIRGPLRYFHWTNWNDLAQNYAATRLWLRGQNFANPENFVALWRDELGSPLSALTVRTHLAPPPGTLVLLAPIGALPWHWAKLLWLTILVGSVIATIWALAATAGFGFKEPRTIMFVAASLAFAPFHTGIATANQTILVVALCALGILAAERQHDLLPGLLFGAACSLKPHIGTFIVAYYLVRRRWRLFATSVITVALLAFVAILWLRVCNVHWEDDYLQNIRVLALQNKIDDFTAANPIRFLLINLQVPFYSFTHNAKWSNVSALTVGIVLVSIWAFVTLKGSVKRKTLLSLSAIAVIGLLPVYHRFYDASLLTIPLCWAVREFSSDLKTVSRAVLLLLIPFLVPGTALLQQLEAHGRVPSFLTSSRLWDCVVMAHQSWCLLALSFVLLYGIMLVNANDAMEPVTAKTASIDG